MLLYIDLFKLDAKKYNTQQALHLSPPPPH